MKQLPALWKDTKYLWVYFLVIVLAIGYQVTWLLAAFFVPWLVGCFCYFAFIRYDNEGHERDTA